MEEATVEDLAYFFSCLSKLSHGNKSNINPTFGNIISYELVVYNVLHFVNQFKLDKITYKKTYDIVFAYSTQHLFVKELHKSKKLVISIHEYVNSSFLTEEIDRNSMFVFLPVLQNLLSQLKTYINSL